MEWEIVARKPDDSKDSRFVVEAGTSAGAVSEAMSWGWVVKSFKANPAAGTEAKASATPRRVRWPLTIAVVGLITLAGKASIRGLFRVSPNPSPAATQGSAGGRGEDRHSPPELLVSTTPDAERSTTRSSDDVPPPSTEPAAKVRYVASKLQSVFHLPNCPAAERIAPGNLQIFETRQAAIDAGHTPCKVCNP